LLEAEEYRAAVFDTIAALDGGEVRVAEKRDGEWRSNAWVMKAINLYFAVAEMQTVEAGPFEYHD
jgi:2,3,4,5-tetrahydropyridine-2-carboxylate N-succinyltransferase